MSMRFGIGNRKRNKQPGLQITGALIYVLIGGDSSLPMFLLLFPILYMADMVGLFAFSF